ncbi:ATP-binding cassette domain-containing protein [Paenibacillus pinihumi]|uniref:ATP-binding cassette domain-containing protein n=1 Tax=Paenibacillus pinihumi TaxID=669462 RepID=UPI000410A336|nr:ABC transporter ATP-binding protein [Paenibacillus pinihumi]
MIEFKNVIKDYGKSIALNYFSLSIEQPGIYCLLGRNGAGKTTFLKTLSGHINTTSGDIYVNGRAVSTLAMPEDVHFIESNASQFNMKLADLFRAADDLNPLFDYGFALRNAERFKLDLKKRYNQLSFGMKTMVNTLLGLSSGKEILVLDEPVMGFDPVMRRTFYELLQESCTERPKIVIVSTHLIDEMAQVAEKLIIINKGELVLYTDMNDIDEKAYCVTGPADSVRKATEGLRIIGETKAGGFLSQYVYDNRITGSDKYAVSALGLQDFFIGLVGDGKEENIR